MLYHRYLNLSVLMLMCFHNKSCTRCKGTCNLHVDGRIPGAECPLYQISMRHRPIRLLCTSPVVLPFHIPFRLLRSFGEGKWPGQFSTILCSFGSLEQLTAAVNQNSFGIKVERQQSQATGMQTILLIYVAPVCNGNNTLTHNMNSRVPNHKIPWNKTLLHTVHKKKKVDFSFPQMNSSVFERQNFH